MQSASGYRKAHKVVVEITFLLAGIDKGA